MNPEKSNNAMSLLIIGAIALIVLGIITLAGISVTNSWSKVLREPAAANTGNASAYTLPVNGSSVAIGTASQYGFLQTATNCRNQTGNYVLGSGNYTVSEGDANGGRLVMSKYADEVEGWKVYCDITYLADTDAQATADAFTVGLGVFGLFATIMAIAIIGMVIIRYFKNI